MSTCFYSFCMPQSNLEPAALQMPLFISHVQSHSYGTSRGVRWLGFSMFQGQSNLGRTTMYGCFILYMTSTYIFCHSSLFLEKKIVQSKTAAARFYVQFELGLKNDFHNLLYVNLLLDQKTIILEPGITSLIDSCHKIPRSGCLAGSSTKEKSSWQVFCPFGIPHDLNLKSPTHCLLL